MDPDGQKPLKVAEKSEQSAFLRLEMEAMLQAERVALIEEQRLLAEQVRAKARAELVTAREKLEAEQQHLESEARQLANRKVLFAEQEKSARKRQVQMEIAFAERRAYLLAEQEKVTALQGMETANTMIYENMEVATAEKHGTGHQQRRSENSAELETRNAEFLQAFYQYAAQRRSKPDKQTGSVAIDVATNQPMVAATRSSLTPTQEKAITELFSRAQSGNITYLQR